MITKETIFKVLDEDWYLQEFNGTPLLIIPCGSSMLDLKPVIGDVFPYWWGWFKGNYGGFYYHHKSLHRIGKLLFEKTRADPLFLETVRKEYEKDFSRDLYWMETVKWDELNKLDDKELIKILKRSLVATRHSVGKGHIIEPFSISTEKHIRLMLSEKIRGAELNKAFPILTAPKNGSFINQSDDMLNEIAQLEGEARTKMIDQYIKTFGWIQNSYAGRVKLDPAEIDKQASTLKYNPFQDEEAAKKELIAKYDLDPLLVRLLDNLRFITEWQDDRKKNILLCLDCIDRTLEELSKRLKMPQNHLRFLLPTEVSEELLTDASLSAKLAERSKQMIIYLTPESESSLVGKDATEFIKKHEELNEVTECDLRGMPASLGNARGKVFICRSLEEINNFEEGCVLVTSMTRPEYLPAMKKACAIVTDEGGITCHAAIVSRELKIPCIIGTKNATKTLKNGMLVEVKANHGIVRVLD